MQETKKPFSQFIDTTQTNKVNWALFLVIVLGITGGLLITIQNFITQQDIDSTALDNPRLKVLKTPKETTSAPNTTKKVQK